jgi:drug/metabolite transporter (DMT)-like permease
MILYFSVIPMMPIAEAGAGLFTSPIFVLLFSFLFFGEKNFYSAIIFFFNWLSWSFF